MSETDRAWFKAHPETNYRLRKPGAGEVDQIILRTHPGAGVELVEMRQWAAAAVASGIELPSSNGNLPCLVPEHEWQVLAVKLPGAHIARMLTIDRLSLQVDGGIGAMGFVMGERIAIEKMKG